MAIPAHGRKNASATMAASHFNFAKYNIVIAAVMSVPAVLTGLLADKSGSLHFAMLLPALCYAVIAAFGIYARRPAEGPVMKALTA